MSSQSGRGPKLDVGRVLAQGFRLAGANALTFGGLALVLYSAPGEASVYFLRKLLPRINPVLAWDGELIAAGMLVMLIPTALMWATLVSGALIAAEGGRPSLGDCLRDGVRRAPLTIVLVALDQTGIYLGYAAVVVPGVLMQLAWFVLTPAAFAERLGPLQAFRRSDALTRGRRGALFVIYVCLLLLVVALAIAVYAIDALSLRLIPSVVGWIGGPLSYADLAPWADRVLRVLLRTCWSVVSCTMAVAAYGELRRAKEGIGLEAPEAVFD